MSDSRTRFRDWRRLLGAVGVVSVLAAVGAPSAFADLGLPPVVEDVPVAGPIVEEVTEAVPVPPVSVTETIEPTAQVVESAPLPAPVEGVVDETLTTVRETTTQVDEVLSSAGDGRLAETVNAALEGATPSVARPPTAEPTRAPVDAPPASVTTVSTTSEAGASSPPTVSAPSSEAPRVSAPTVVPKTRSSAPADAGPQSTVVSDATSSPHAGLWTPLSRISSPNTHISSDATQAPAPAAPAEPTNGLLPASASAPAPAFAIVLAALAALLLVAAPRPRLLSRLAVGSWPQPILDHSLERPG